MGSGATWFAPRFTFAFLPGPVVNNSMNHAVSGCASYIALVAGAELQIHQLLPPALFRTYNLVHCFAAHRLSRPNTQTPPPTDAATPEVALIEWETSTGARCTKVAVYARSSDLHAVLVFVLDQESPIVIEQDPLGVEALQWVPGRSDRTAGAGAYSGCTQLCVFAALGLEMRLYSLDCTHVLLTVPKPLHNHIFVRPGASDVWSAVATPYYDKNLAQRSILADAANQAPVLYHFYNDGSVSKVLAALPVDATPATDFRWSASGKWLLCFQSVLGKFNLRVFNLLAVHTRPVGMVTRHKAQETASYNDTTNSTDWVCVWLAIDACDYAVALTSDSAQTLTMRAYDISHMTVSRTLSLLLAMETAWILSRSGSSIVYKRVVGSPSLSLHKWRVAFSAGNHILVVTDHLAVLVAAKKDCPLSLDVVLVVSALLKFLTAKLLSDGRLLVVFSDHAAVQTQSGLEVLATSRYQFTEAHITERFEQELRAPAYATITMVEKTASGPVWRQIDHQLDQEETADDSNLEIMRKFHYMEESSKVVNLMHDVQHNEWGLKRALQEPTDTFSGKRKIQK